MNRDRTEKTIRGSGLRPRREAEAAESEGDTAVPEGECPSMQVDALECCIMHHALSVFRILFGGFRISLGAGYKDP